jgi:poly(A) polymerase
LRFLWNMAYRGVFYLGVYVNAWEGPKTYSLKQLKLNPKDFNARIADVALKLQKHGYDAYIVGGSIRDLLLRDGVVPKDFDIVTSALPQQIKKCFSRSRIIGKRFRIVHVPVGREVVEVCTFRGATSWLSWCFSDRYRNNIYGSIEQDVWRRDFSCNALYYDVKNANVVDFTGGVQDIKNKKLAVIGTCKARFKDDPVRMLRALRFLAKTNFRMDSSCKEEIKRQKRWLRQVSKDRLLLELTKLFNQGHACASFKALVDYDYLGTLFSGYERLGIKIENYQQFFKSVFHAIDLKYQRNQRLSSSFLFAALLWPIFDTHANKLNKKTTYSVKKVVYRVLKFESRYVAIPGKLQEAIRDLWMLQFLLETKEKPFSEDRYRQPRFQVGYELFCLRAKHNEVLAEKAIMWQSQFESANTNHSLGQTDE